MPKPLISTLGYLGPIGTYSNQAAVQWANQNPGVVIQPCQSFFELFFMLSKQTIDAIIVPVENSIEGAVSNIMDLFLNHANTYIVAELLCPVSHCLLTQSKESDIQLIMSHTQALSQCQQYLSKHWPTAQTHATISTSKAAELLANNKLSDYAPEHVGVIGSEQLADHYGLHIVTKNINDVTPNITRFVVVSRHHATATGNDKTSMILFPRHNEPGTLATTLQHFAEASINLTKVESRPARNKLGNYVFFIDFEGHKEDPVIQTILNQIGRENRYQWLGSYPKAE
jgi:prephenate dehydratase